MDIDSPSGLGSPRAGGSSSAAGGSGSGSGAAIGPDSLPFLLSHEDELEEDDVPDEDLDTTSGKHQLWLVKVPGYLMEEWNRVKVPDVQLATVRVYDELDASGKQKMELLLPDDWPTGTGPITSASAAHSPSHKRKAGESDSKPGSSKGAGAVPKVFDLKLAPYDAASANLYAFREQWEGDDGDGRDSISGSQGGTPADSGPSRGRKRPRVTTALIGCVANETHVQAKVDAKGGVAAEVREQLRRRRAEAESKKRSIQMLDADEGTANMLASGVNVGLLKSRFGKFSIAKASGSAKNVDKRARMPKNELLDMLWPMFEAQTHLRLKTIAERTQQPEAYLRDVLADVADLHKRGPYTGHYSIKPDFLSAVHASAASGGGSASQSASASASASTPAPAAGDATAGTKDDEADAFEDVV